MQKQRQSTERYERSEEVLAEDFQEPKWYVLFVRSNQEKPIAKHLEGRDIEHFLPCYQSLRQWKDRRVMLDMPLFPGYIFVRTSLAARGRVLTVPNIVSLVGVGNCPSPVSDEEIAGIRRGVEHGRVEPHAYLNFGERVVITQGVLCGMEGILASGQNGGRVVISVDSISRSYAVEVDASCIMPVRRSMGPASDDRCAIST